MQRLPTCSATLPQRAQCRMGLPLASGILTPGETLKKASAKLKHSPFLSFSHSNSQSLLLTSALNSLFHIKNFLLSVYILQYFVFQQTPYVLRCLLVGILPREIPYTILSKNRALSREFQTSRMVPVVFLRTSQNGQYSLCGPAQY